MQIFELMDKHIHYSQIYRGQKYFHWTLPRMSGVTTYLTRKAEGYIKDGKSVLYISYPSQRDFDYNVEDQFRDAYEDGKFHYRSTRNLERHMGMGVGLLDISKDIILIDGELTPKQLTYIRNSVQPTWPGLILHLETTDG